MASSFVIPEGMLLKNKSAQEAHEAIRPTDFSVHSIGKFFTPEDKLYQLIWKSVQYPPKCLMLKLKELELQLVSHALSESFSCGW